MQKSGPLDGTQFGCQYHDRTFTPTVSVGLCIWGVPVTIGLGVVLLSLGAG